MQLSIDIISDVICPWCFIGKRRFEKAVRLLPEDTQAQVRWRPFELNPHMPPEGMDRKLYRTRKFGSSERSQALDAQLTEAGASEGIPFAFDRMERTPNTVDAHRLIWLAGKEGAQGAMVDGLFDAYFIQGLDIGDREVLAHIAASAGVEEDRARAFLDSSEGRNEIQAEELWARRLGVEGVPFFLINSGVAISGAQKPEIIAATLRQAIEAGVS